MPPLPIGMILPVIVPIQIENVGSSHIRFEIEDKEIHENNMNNGSARVLEIGNPTIHLENNQKHSLFVHFKYSCIDAGQARQRSTTSI